LLRDLENRISNLVPVAFLDSVIGMVLQIKKIYGENLCADDVSVEVFREIFRRILKKEELSLSQIYNVDETSCFFFVSLYQRTLRPTKKTD
jgi:hypothetical protein